MMVHVFLYCMYISQRIEKLFCSWRTPQKLSQPKMFTFESFRFITWLHIHNNSFYSHITHVQINYQENIYYDYPFNRLIFFCSSFLWSIRVIICSFEVSQTFSFLCSFILDKFAFLNVLRIFARFDRFLSCALELSMD